MAADFHAMRALVACDEAPFFLTLFDLETGEPLRFIITEAGVLCLAADFTRMRALCGYDNRFLVDWDLQTGKMKRRMEVGHWEGLGEASFWFLVFVHCVAADFAVEQALCG